MGYKFGRAIGCGIRIATTIQIFTAVVSMMAQTPSALPVNVQVQSNPAAFVGSDGITYIAYEVDLTNVDSHQRTLTLLEATVTDAAQPAVPLAKFAGADWKAMREASSLPSKTSDPAALPPATHALFFMWIKVPPSASKPLRLNQAFSFQLSGVEGTRSMECCAVPVQHTALVVSAPLSGEQWAAANGPSNKSEHRRSLLPIDGKLYLSQRFAIDWIKLDASGHYASGDGSENSQFFDYGQPVLAVADATVAAIGDGIPENKPGGLAEKIDYSNIAGNFVSLDLGGGYFAGYAHLQPGSIRVKKGQRVRRGDVLGLLGNSGNSDAPHLHFQISNAPSIIESEGLPYALDSFNTTGAVDSDMNFTPEKLAGHKDELPLENAVVTFH